MPLCRRPCLAASSGVAPRSMPSLGSVCRWRRAAAPLLPRAWRAGAPPVGGEASRRGVATLARRRPQGSPASDAEAAPDAAAEAEAPAAGSVDLVRCVPTGGAWAEASLPQRWLAFSDLHVSPRTLGTCVQVLESVHEEAARRGAGILFLGDFWHTRGTLPVEPLNAVVERLAAWRQPTLMLPGNHDQVSLGGEVHALTPLAAANPLLHAFDGPTLFLGALWLPFRRRREELEAALAAAKAAAADAGQGGAASAPPLRAVFAHTDIAGALMNEAYQAHDGLPPDIFPPDLPTYTGHYHLPHTVPGSRITYLGSPYQVTRAEAGQQKRLLLLDRAAGWEVAEQLPLDLGPRYFSAAAVPATQAALAPADAGADASEAEASGGLDTAAEAAAPAESEAAATAAAEGAQYQLEVPADLRAGDRLLLTMPAAAAKQHAKQLRRLQQKGVQVELFSPPEAAATPRLGPSEGLAPMQLWQRYAAWQRLPAAAVAAGAELLAGLLGGGVGGAAGRLEGQHVRLEFEAVEVEGYFSFQEPVRYQLGKRGLVVVTGQVHDTPEAGVESNGAGKTALVMAPLWALTGSVDARAEGAAASGARPLLADIVNDGCKKARVRVEGRANGAPFAVERTATRRGSSLTFHLDGQDLTTQEVRLTQQRIDELLGAELLGRTVFYGQSDVTALLEASDRAFKAELSKLVDLELWGAAKEASRAQLAARRDAQRDAAASLRERSAAADALERQLAALQAAADEAAAAAAEAAGGLRREAAELLGRLQGQRAALAAAAGAARGQAAGLQADAAGLERQLGAVEQQQEQLRVQLGDRTLTGADVAQLAADAEARLQAAQQQQAQVLGEQQRRQFAAGAAASGAAEAAAAVAEARDEAAAARAEVEGLLRLHPDLADGSDGKPAAVRLDGLRTQLNRSLAAAADAERRITAASVASAAQAARASAARSAADRAQQDAAAAAAAAELAASQLGGEEAPPLERLEAKLRSLRQRGEAAQQRLGAALGLARERRQQLAEFLFLDPAAFSGGSGLRQEERLQATPGAAAAGGEMAAVRGAEHEPLAESAPGSLGAAVCDRCHQPITAAQFEESAERLRLAATQADGAAAAAERKLAALQQAAAEAEAAVAQAVRRQGLAAAAEAATTAAARAAAAAAAAEAQAVAESAQLAADETAAAEAEATLACQRAAARELKDEVEEAEGAAELEGQLSQLQRLAAAAAAGVQAATERHSAAEAAAAAAAAALQQLESEAAAAADEVAAAQTALAAAREQGGGAARLAQEAALLRGQREQLQRRGRWLEQQLAAAEGLCDSELRDAATELQLVCGSGTEPLPPLLEPGLAEAAGEDAAAALEAAVAAARGVAADCAELAQRWRWQQAQPNLPARDAALVAAQLGEARGAVAEAEGKQAVLEEELALWKQVDDCFLPRGVPNFVVEGVLGDLQAAAARNLSALTSGMSLTLNPCKPAAAAARKRKGGGDGEGAAGGTIEQIEKIVHVRQPGSLEMRQRSVRQLSGGERRRVALALALGFGELAAQRGRLRSNLIVLDEVMQHLDGEGCLRVAQLLKQLPYSSVLVVAQAHSLLTQAFDATDVVVKSGGTSTVEQGSSAAVA